MAAKTWIGGNANASLLDASQWSPAGQPLPGDTLYFVGASGYLRNADLAQAPISFAAPGARSAAPSTLALRGITNTALVAGGAHEGTSDTVDVQGLAFSSLTMKVSYLPSTLTETIEHDAQLFQSFTINAGQHADILTITAADASGALVNDGASSANNAHVRIDAKVLGFGSFAIGGGTSAYATLEFGDRVAASQSIDVQFGGGLIIDHARLFDAGIDLAAANSFVDFRDVVAADGYSLGRDVLTFYQGNQVLHRVHLSLPRGAAVQVTESAGGAEVRAAPIHATPLGGPGARLLPERMV